MTHAEMDAWSARMPRESVRQMATRADSVMATWVRVHLHDTHEVMHLLSWLPSARYDRGRAAYAAGLVSIELAVICAAWPVTPDVALGRVTRAPLG